MYSTLSRGEKRLTAAVSVELEHIWSRVQEELALAVDEPTYRIWLAPLRPVQLAGEQLVVEAPPHTCDWIHDRFGRVIQASVELILGPHAAVEIAAALPDQTRPPARAVRPYSRQPPS